MRQVIVRLTMTMIQEVEDDWTEEEARFFFEEHNCRDNLIWRLAADANVVEGTCASCHRSEVKYLGVATVEDVAKYGNVAERQAAFEKLEAAKV